MSNTIDLREVLRIIHSGQFFECSLVNANRHKGTGGTIVHLKRCRLARKQSAEFSQAQQQWEKLPPPLRNAAPGKNPMHALHFTRNIELPGRQLYKLHPLFIFRLNGKTVV